MKTAGLTKRFDLYLDRDRIMNPPKPATARMIPPTSIQMDLSVGEPVKNWETSELKESIALIPKMIRMTPPTRRAIEIIWFMMGVLSIWG